MYCKVLILCTILGLVNADILRFNLSSACAVTGADGQSGGWPIGGGSIPYDPYRGGGNKDPFRFATGGCDISTLLNFENIGGNDVVLSAAGSGAYRVRVKDNLAVRSLSISSDSNSMASLEIAHGNIVRVSGNFNVSGSSYVQVAGSLIVNGLAHLAGYLNVTASAVFSAGLKVAASAELHATESAYVTVENANDTIDGVITAFQNTTIKFNKIFAKFNGFFNADNSSKIIFSQGHVIVNSKANVSGTVEVENCDVSAHNGTVNLDSVRITDGNNTFRCENKTDGFHIGKNLTVEANASLRIAARSVIDSHTRVFGNLSIAEESHFTDQLDITASALLHVHEHTNCTVANTTAFIDGLLMATNNSIFHVENATVAFTGQFFADESSHIRAALALLIFDGEAAVNGSVELAHHVHVSARKASTAFFGFVVVGVNNTVDAVDGAYVEVVNNISVAVDGTLKLLGRVNAHGLVVVNGSVECASKNFSSSHIQFQGGLAVDVNGYINASAYVSVSAKADIDGTFVLGDNATLHVRNETTRIGTVIVDGLNATVRSTEEGMIQCKQNASVAADASVTFGGKVIHYGNVTALGRIFIGFNETIYGSFNLTSVEFHARLDVNESFVVHTHSKVLIASDAFFNSTTLFAKNTTVHIAGMAIFQKDVICYGNTTVSYALNVTNRTASYIQRDGVLVLNYGLVNARKVYIGEDASVSTSAYLRGIGSIQGDVRVSGTVAVGFSPGSVNVTGDYTLTDGSSTELELASGSSHDSFNISGKFDRAGTLIIKLLNGYTPSAGSSFVFSHHSSASGSFGSIRHSNSTNMKFVEVNDGTTTAVVLESDNTGNTASSNGISILLLVVFVVLSVLFM